MNLVCLVEGWASPSTPVSATLLLKGWEMISACSLSLLCASQHELIYIDTVLIPSKYLKDFITDTLSKDHRQRVKKAESFVHLYDLEPPSKMSNSDHMFYMHAWRMRIYNIWLPFHYYLHSKEINPTTLDILVFRHLPFTVVHMSHWYQNKRLPLCDEGLRSLISTTSLPMLSGSSTAVSKFRFSCALVDSFFMIFR
jgi:hypothetical protein